MLIEMNTFVGKILHIIIQKLLWRPALMDIVKIFYWKGRLFDISTQAETEKNFKAVWDKQSHLLEKS